MTPQEYLQKNPKKYLIFDFDETIAKMEIDWDPLYKEWAKIFQKFDPEFKHYKGQRLNKLANVFVAKYGIELKREISLISRDYELLHCKRVILNNELISQIKLLNNLRLFIFSNNSQDFIDKNLKQLGIRDKFEKIISREEVMLIKPETEGVEKITHHTGDSNVNNYLYIGDSLSDMEAAKRMKMDFFLIDYFRNLK